MAKKKTKKGTPRPSKAAMEVAKAMLAPTDLMAAMTRQLELQAQQLDQMDATLKQLYTVVTGKPFPPTNLLTEPAPLPSSNPLNG